MFALLENHWKLSAVKMIFLEEESIMQIMDSLMLC